MDVGMSHLSDTALVSLLADADDLAFYEMVARHGPAMKRYAMYFTHSEADADEATQEALITAWQSVEQLENPAALRSWLMKTTARKSLDLVRKRKPHSPIEGIDVAEDKPDPQDHADLDETAGRLKTIVNGLPETQQNVWVLREIGDMTYDEIAEVLEVSEATVRGRLSRARATIAKEMEEWR